MARYVRTKVELGTIEITQAVANSAAAEHQLLFMPGVRPPLESLYRHGVEPLYRNRLGIGVPYSTAMGVPNLLERTPCV